MFPPIIPCDSDGNIDFLTLDVRAQQKGSQVLDHSYGVHVYGDGYPALRSTFSTNKETGTKGFDVGGSNEEAAVVDGDVGVLVMGALARIANPQREVEANAKGVRSLSNSSSILVIFKGEGNCCIK